MLYLLLLLWYFALGISLLIVFLWLLDLLSIYSYANYIAVFMLNMPSLVLPIMILNVLSARYVAYYYVASMIQTILQVIPQSASQALLTEGSYDEARLKQHVKKSLKTILVILT